MTMVARLFVNAPGERRQDTRHPLDAAATLRVARTVPRDVLIHDLSAGGCQFVSAKPIALGSSISVGIAGVGMREATIVRSHAGLHGCAFEQPLNATELNRAGRIDTVHSGHFVIPAGSELLEPSLGKYSGATRLGVLLASAAAAWALLILGIAALG